MLRKATPRFSCAKWAASSVVKTFGPSRNTISFLLPAGRSRHTDEHKPSARKNPSLVVQIHGVSVSLAPKGLPSVARYRGENR